MKLGLQLGYWTRGPEDPIDLVLEAEKPPVGAQRARLMRSILAHRGTLVSDRSSRPG